MQSFVDGYEFETKMLHEWKHASEIVHITLFLILVYLIEHR